MADQHEQERRDLSEKILAKRQQVEFEKNNIEYKSELSSENRENPDVSEEFKNFDDPAENVIDKGELVELSKAEKDLIDLIDKLNKLNKQE